MPWYLLFCHQGARGSSAEPVPVEQLWHAGQAETSQDTAKATCVWLRAGPAGPLAWPGTALLLCLCWRLVDECPGCGPARCHPELQLSCLLWPLYHLDCNSEWCLPWQSRERQGHSSLVLLIKNAGVKCIVLILLCGRICRAEVALFPRGPVPVGAMSSGNFMEGEGERSRVTFQSPLRTRSQTMTLGWTLHRMECRQQTLTVRAALGNSLAARDRGWGGGHLLLRIKPKP